MEERYGLPMLCSWADPSGWLGEHRLRRAGRSLRRGGALRTLAPEGFDRWELLEDFGLVRVATGPFLRSQSAPLALGALERRGAAPDRAVVALRGERADRELVRAAVQLCPKVRRLVIDAPRGGRELAVWLRQEFGMPILPAGEGGTVALSFAKEAAREQEETLHLYGANPSLDGPFIQLPDLAEHDRNNLPLLAILWENRRLDPERLKIT